MMRARRKLDASTESYDPLRGRVVAARAPCVSVSSLWSGYLPHAGDGGPRSRESAHGGRSRVRQTSTWRKV